MEETLLGRNGSRVSARFLFARTQKGSFTLAYPLMLLTGLDTSPILRLQR
jgi:hypothetical protein